MTLAEAQEVERAIEALAESRPPRADAPVEFAALLADAWDNLIAGEVEDALTKLQRARALSEGDTFDDGDRAEVLFRLGACRLHLGAVSNAVQLLTVALELCDRSGRPCDRLRNDILRWRTRSYRRQRDWDGARADAAGALTLAEGFGDAVREAHEQGFASILRLAGGRAAVFHERTLAFSWAIPLPSPREGIRARFELLAALMAEAFRSLGVDARVGAVPGEYCPGEFSVNARGATKLMGVGQRIVRHAAHVGGVVVVGDGARVRDVLIPVYRALDLAWDPSTSGSLQDEVPGVRWEDARRAIVERFADRFELVGGHLGPETLERAGVFEPDHLATV